MSITFFPCSLFSKFHSKQTYFLKEPNDQMLVHVEPLHQEILDMLRFET